MEKWRKNLLKDVLATEQRKQLVTTVKEHIIYAYKQELKEQLEKDDPKIRQFEKFAEEWIAIEEFNEPELEEFINMFKH